MDPATKVTEIVTPIIDAMFKSFIADCLADPELASKSEDYRQGFNDALRTATDVVSEMLIAEQVKR